MKNLKFNFLLMTLFTLGLTFSSCGNKTSNDGQTEQVEQQGKEYTSAYVCPMHCEGSGSDQPGTCPVCNMDYVENEAHNYACSMHPEITGDKGDKCSKCGMNLTPMSGEDHKEHNH